MTGDAEKQYTAVEVYLLPGGPTGGEGQVPEADTTGEKASGEAPKKKAKIGPNTAAIENLKSARLRHILVRFQDTPRPADGMKKAVRDRPAAEALLRQLLREFHTELEDLRRKYGRLKKPEELALKSEKFAKVCKEHSACPTAQKGGGMCGDLGWMPREAQRKLGKDFQDAVSVLRPGDWSDIVAAADGLHIIQRIA